MAEEVRNLAQRSAKAANDTKTIIEKNIELSKSGMEVAGRVGESLSEINRESINLNKLIEEINVATKEQAQGIDQINQALSQMEQVTQQNAANAEETASSSEELNAQAENLNSLVGELSRMVGGSGGRRPVDHQRDHDNDQKHDRRKRVNGMQSVRPSNKKTHIASPDDVIPLD